MTLLVVSDQTHFPLYPFDAQTFLASFLASSDGSMSLRDAGGRLSFLLAGGIGRPVVVFVLLADGFVAEIGHFHGCRIVQRRAPCLDARDAHVQAAVHVEVGLFALSDRLGKVVGREKVSAAVPCAGCPVVMDREVGLVHRFDRIALALFPRFAPDAQPLSVAVTAVFITPLLPWMRT